MASGAGGEADLGQAGIRLGGGVHGACAGGGLDGGDSGGLRLHALADQGSSGSVSGHERQAPGFHLCFDSRTALVLPVPIEIGSRICSRWLIPPHSMPSVFRTGP